jgi:hypothetical protein
VATARTVINPANLGSIKFADNSAGIAAGVEQGFQIIDFKVVPKPNLSSAAGTYGAPPSDVPGASSFGLVIAYFQDWGTTNSLSEYLFTNDGVLKFFRIDPATAGVKGMEGPCYIVAGAFAGAAGGNWIDTANMPCPIKPTLLTAT